MLEIKPNTWLVKAKILGMKIANKDGKYWVVFNLGKVEKEEQSAFSEAYPSAAEAQAFAVACGSSL